MKKEEFEWIHSWCDQTNKKDLPRVLLIGDSITHGYNNFVRDALKGKMYVDYIATSYAIDNPYYRHLIIEFAKNSKYDLIHFNFCLHGFHIKDVKYEKLMTILVEKLSKISKVTLAEGTKVIYKKETNKSKNEELTILNRNSIISRLGSSLNIPVDKLFSVSANINHNYRFQDGIHFLENGYKILGNAVANFLLENI